MQNNYIQDLQNSILNSLMKKHNERLTDAIKNSLIQLGYSFTSEDEFLDFCKNRVHLVREFETESLYLDYKDEFNRGIILAKYPTKMEWKEDNGSVTLYCQ